MRVKTKQKKKVTVPSLAAQNLMKCINNLLYDIIPCVPKMCTLSVSDCNNTKDSCFSPSTPLL